MEGKRLIFYDFEVFVQDWMVVLIDYETRIKKVIVNDRKELKRVYEKNKELSKKILGILCSIFNSIFNYGYCISFPRYLLE